MMLTRTEAAEEREILLRAQKGDEHAFETLFQKYNRRAFGLARNVVGNEDTARDVVQQAFIRVFRYIRTFDVSRRFYTWLYQIVVNLSIDAMRRQASRSALPFDETTDGTRLVTEDPETHATKIELRERVKRCIDSLPEHYKSALVLRDIEGFTCEEVADLLQCKNSTARWRIHYARKLFKASWLGAGEAI